MIKITSQKVIERDNFGISGWKEYTRNGKIIHCEAAESIEEALSWTSTDPSELWGEERGEVETFTYSSVEEFKKAGWFDQLEKKVLEGVKK